MEKLLGRTVLPILVFNLLFLFTVNSFAQDLDEVSISGKITDSNDLAIVGATITATLMTTGVERTVVTNDDGRYKIIELSPGLYKVSASASGFGTKERIELETISGQNVQLNFSLSPADVVVDPVQVVEDNASVVDTTRTVVGGTITQLEIEELPNNSRNALDLVLTLGGTSEEALSVRDLAEDRNANPRVPPAEQGLFSLSGGASYSNNITIDGLDNNDDRSAGDRFQPSLESIAEVQVITNQFSAEYGRASGGRINLRTRAGTNKFRGRAFMFFRDDNLNSNTWYNNSRGISRLPLTEYNPGFTFGGPIFKNKTFFSVAYEYTNLQDTTFIDTYVPVGTNPLFTLPTSTGGTQGCDNSSPSACTTNPPTAGLIAPYQLSIPTPNYNHSFTTRIDHKLFENNDFTFGWQLGRRKNRRTIGSSTRIEDALQARSSDTDALNFTDNQIFGANFVNQFRMQWSVYEPNYQTENPFDPVILIGYRNPVTNSVQTLIAGNSTASTLQNFSSNRKETRWQFQDSITYLAGSHTIKAGLDIQYVNSEDLSLGDATGTFNFSSVLFYQQNNVTRFRQNFGTARDVTNTYWGVFANDEFKARPNLTLSYGLRFERETAVSDQNNFGPRVGVAYSPWKSGKGVIRFGAGIFYNRTLLRTVGDYIQNNSGNLFMFDSNNIGTSGSDTRRIAVLGAISQQFPSRFESVDDLKNLLTSVGQPATLGFTPSSLIRSVDPNLKIPESYQFNIGFEREIGKGFVFEANLTSNKTSHLWREYNPNLPVLPSGFDDWTDYLLANPFLFQNAGNNTIRTYRFYLGATNDPSGTATTQGGTTACSTTTTVTCFVNLNTVNSTTTFPSTAVSGSTTNSTGTPLGIALAAIARFRPDTSVGEKEVVSSIGNAYYRGLVLELRSRYRKLGYGFSSSLRAVYTLSSTKDDGLNNTTNAEINGDFSREWARSLQDRRHRIAISGVFESPWWLGKVRFSPLFRFGSSAPFSLGYGVDRNLNDTSTDRPIFTGNINDIKWREPGSPFPTELASQFSLPPIGSIGGNLPRNAGKGPSFYTFDLSLTREWKFGERFKLRPTVQFDNILNAAVFSFGSEFIDFTALSNNPSATQLANYQSFLIPTRTYRQRQIRVGIRFDF